MEHDILFELSECNNCMGCIDLNPEIFGWDENTDRPYLKKNKATEDEIRDALSCCPGDCISLALDD